MSFPLPPVRQPGQHFGPCKAEVATQLPSALLARQPRTSHSCMVPRLSWAAKLQGCEGSNASLRDAAELGVCYRTWWLGFHHASDELCCCFRMSKTFLCTKAQWDRSGARVGLGKDFS